MKLKPKNVGLFLSGSGTVIAISWLADGLKGECLFEPWWGACDQDAMLLRICLAAIAFIVFAFVARVLVEDWLPVQHFAHNKKVAPHKVLIMPLSTFNPVPQKDEQGRWVVQDKDGQDRQVEGVILQGDLEHDIHALESNNKTRKWNGLPFLRGLKPHLVDNKLERLFLIGSNGDDGSSQQLDALCQVARQYTDAYIEPIRDIDFHSVKDLQGELESLIKKVLGKNYKENDIIIDVTGGPKTTSIAGALASLEWPGVEFQYVDTAHDHGVHSYNVVVNLPKHSS